MWLIDTQRIVKLRSDSYLSKPDPEPTWFLPIKIHYYKYSKKFWLSGNLNLDNKTGSDPTLLWKLDPDPTLFWKLDPDPTLFWKLDPDPTLF